MTSPPGGGVDLATWAQSLGFTVEQLVLNRAGAAAPEQLRGFGWLIFRNLATMLFLTGTALVVAMVVKPWWRWLAVMGQIAMATFFAVKGINEIRDLIHPEVRMTEGSPTFAGGYRNTVNMRIGGKDFTFGTGMPEGRKPWQLIKSDRRYRIYFLRHTGNPLTIEPASDSPEAVGAQAP
jgi:hypothetical protein